jgi:hypothetical protein
MIPFNIRGKINTGCGRLETRHGRKKETKEIYGFFENESVVSDNCQENNPSSVLIFPFHFWC